MSSTVPPHERAALPPVAPASPAAAARLRRVGLVLLLGGLGLTIVSLFVPWLTKSCESGCGPDAIPPPGIGLAPLTDGPNSIILSFPDAALYWGPVAVFSLALLWQEILPIARRTAAPALVLAGLFVCGLLFTLLLLSVEIAFTAAAHRPAQEVDRVYFGPGLALGIEGIGLFAAGGWLRYESGRRVPPVLPPVPSVPPVAPTAS